MPRQCKVSTPFTLTISAGRMSCECATDDRMQRPVELAPPEIEEIGAVPENAARGRSPAR
jgi:hypothetical protein